MRKISLFLSAILFISCSSQLLKYKEDDFKTHGKYQEELKIETLPEPSPKPEPTPEPTPEPKAKLEPRSKKQVNQKAPEKKKPKLADKKDEYVSPFRVGEKSVIRMSYMGMTAGLMSFEVRNFVKANGKKAYHFYMSAETLKLFEMVYKVKNELVTYVQQDSGLPLSFELNVNESRKVRQARALFDWSKKEVRYWEKLYTKDDGLKQIEEKWELDKKFQNAYSMVFMMRRLPLEVGKSYTDWVIHKKEKIKVVFDVLREEKIQNELGEFDTIVVQPKLYKKGKLDEKTDVKFWLTNDDRKMIVQLKADVKIGSLNGELVQYVP
tara:strand:- start:8534 stop:9502 length:969 start_codon:yes stop_codon:yes gene_type:complete